MVAMASVLAAGGWLRAAEVDMTSAQRQLSVVPLPKSDLQLDLWLNKADPVYGAGEFVEIFVRSSKDAYVTIFNTDARGATTAVFPNRFTQDHRVPADRIVRVPGPGADFKFQAQAPYGSNLIKVIATERRVTLLEAAEFAQAGAFRTYSGGAEGLARQLQVVSARQPQAGWASAQLAFTITSKRAASADGPTVTVVPEGGTAASGIPALDALLNRSEGFRLQLAMNKYDYGPADSLSLTAVAEKDCELTLVNVDEQGRGTVLLPNRIVKRRPMKAGMVQFLPESGSEVRYRVSSQAGRQALIGFCVEGRSRPGFFGQLFSGSRSVVAVLGDSGFDAMLEEIGSHPAVRVAKATVSYRVNEK